MGDVFVNQIQRIGDSTNGLAPAEAAIIVDPASFAITDDPSSTYTGQGASITGATRLALQARPTGFIGITFLATGFDATITMATIAGIGAGASSAINLRGQTGQAQTGSQDNNDGGGVELEGGDAGSGGSGATAGRGPATLRGGHVLLTADAAAGNQDGYLIAQANTGGAIQFKFANTVRLQVDGTGLGFFGATGHAKPTITGSRGGNAALASLLTALATMGLIVDGSS